MELLLSESLHVPHTCALNAFLVVIRAMKKNWGKAKRVARRHKG